MCFELRCKQEGSDSWRYLSAGEDGILLWPTFAGLRLGRYENMTPRALLLPPLDKGAVHEWEERGSIQTTNGPGPTHEPTDEDLVIHHVLTIEAIDELVSVGAGRFTCVRVKDATTSKCFGSTETVTWFAADTGPVKWTEKTRYSEIPSVVELASFEPGTGR
ncbi:MAG TPA: hypothetical protein VFF73_16050 [Planctomycetota bacterium]|nr:hypothetical protein [Planctomycetota bacterium]